MNVNLTINGQPVTVPKGTTILEAARKAGVHIPTLCDHADLRRRAICRICVVECEGNDKLIVACANAVWEGANVFTNNRRVLEARRTILELILANHPQDCLSCIRNKNCELQILAENVGIRSVPFERTADSSPPSIEGKTIVRDMDKCVKCGRCIEMCQEVQAIGAINTFGRSKQFGICSPYGQALQEGPCVFCGQCAQVCPVGAIYEHDQSVQILEALNSNPKRIDAEIPVSLAKGKIIAALRQLGFKKVTDMAASSRLRDHEFLKELDKKIMGDLQGKLPMITGCSKGVYRFVKHFYPDLTDHLVNCEIGSSVVSIVPCIALKYDQDNIITIGELERVIKLAGIDLASLPEEALDPVDLEFPPTLSNLSQKETIRGFAQAHKVMEEIQKGECKAQWIDILSCFNPTCPWASEIAPIH